MNCKPLLSLSLSLPLHGSFLFSSDGVIITASAPKLSSFPHLPPLFGGFCATSFDVSFRFLSMKCLYPCPVISPTFSLILFRCKVLHTYFSYYYFFSRKEGREGRGRGAVFYPFSTSSTHDCFHNSIRFPSFLLNTSTVLS